MTGHHELAALRARSLRLQDQVRRATWSPEQEKTLRRFSSWEVSELILRINPSTFRGKLAEDPTLPQGEIEPDGRQRWFSLEEIGELRRRLKLGRRRLIPPRPPGRAIRAAVANFKGGAGKSTVALHFAHAAALEGYRVLLVDFDPQATLSHAMGIADATEERTVWGIIARDLERETVRMNAAPAGAFSGRKIPARALPASVAELGLGRLAAAEFVRPTAWPTIDLVPSCANAAFVEFASAQYRHLNPDWSFFAAVARWLAEIPDDAYDLVLFDCPPAIGYQSMNAAFAADLLVIPSGPGYWEYDSTTSFVGQLAEALEDLEAGFAGAAASGGLGGVALPKTFADLRFVLTRFEPGNPLHAAMQDAFAKAFGAHVAAHPVELTRAVEQSGRFLCSVYEIDYREMTRETWKRARASFDRAFAEFMEAALAAWPHAADESAGGITGGITGEVANGAAQRGAAAPTEEAAL